MLQRQIRSYVFTILVAYFGIMLLIALVSLSGQHYAYHYQGKTIVTSEQYATLAIATTANNGTATLAPSMKLTYDFYSSKQYDFLNSKSVEGFWDNPAVSSLRIVFGGTFKNVIAGIVIGGMLIFLLYRYQRKVLNAALRFYKSFLRFKYRRLSVANGNVVTDFQVSCKGIVAVRSWRCSSKGILTSLVHSTVWKRTALEADALPQKENFSGVYAYRLGAPAVQQGEVMGLVEMRGRYWYHPDGVVRAESCNILCLFLHNASGKLSQHLSVKYGVPVCTANTSDEAYVSWLFSKQGLQGLQHNMELLGE